MDDVRWEAGFAHDAVDEPVGGDGGGGGLPDDDVAHEGGCGGEVAADGGEVEGGDGVDEAFEGTVFETASGRGSVFRLRGREVEVIVLPDILRVEHGLLTVELLGVFHVESGLSVSHLLL